METKQTKERIKETFVLGIKGVYNISGIKKIFYSNWVNKCPIFTSILIVLLVIVLKVNAYKLIIEIKDIMINFLPGILGFTIAGYALVVGFTQAGMLTKITEPSSDSNYSLYQKMSSTFAINILLQAIALLVAFLFHFIDYLYKNNGVELPNNNNIALGINFIGLAIISYCFVFSLLITIQIVVNIFDFSQLNHYLINSEKVNKTKNEA